MENIIDLEYPKDEFIKLCVNRITENKQTIEKSLHDCIEYIFNMWGKKYDFFVSAKYKYSFEHHDMHLSLKEYINEGYMQLWYGEIIIECIKNTVFETLIIKLPKYIKHEQRSLMYPHDFTPDEICICHKRKTKKPTFSLKIYEIRIFNDILTEIYSLLPDELYLLPSKFRGEDDWRQTYYKIKNGVSYFCSCFREAITKQIKIYPSLRVNYPHIKYALENEAYLDNLCDLCNHSVPRKKWLSDEFSFTYSSYISKICWEKGLPFKESENIVRKMVGFPLIGEGWISEIELYHRIKSDFRNTEVIHHGRPSFLGRQHYDIWIPEFKIAIEYQGEQHAKAVDYFGGENTLLKQKERDERKRKISKDNGVFLIFVKKGYNYENLKRKIEANQIY
jgi:hypothetical protein